MIDHSTLLTLLEVTVPPDTALTVPNEVKILEIVGIVANPDMIKAMNLAETLAPPATPATLQGLVHLLSGLGKMNPDTPQSSHDTLATLLQNLQKAPDVPLTFGMFLPILRSFQSAAARKPEHEGRRREEHEHERPSRRRGGEAESV
ncbi:MAG TPA: hypothetical protein VN694_05220 [Caulobacteraceae bacterium]|nr:hypothetical protein [Caulobacteraceae bacterium]